MKTKSKDYIISEEDGTYMGQRVLPLERVGVYVPGEQQLILHLF